MSQPSACIMNLSLCPITFFTDSARCQLCHGFPVHADYQIYSSNWPVIFVATGLVAEILLVFYNVVKWVEHT